MEIIMKRVEELTPYERNPRRNDEAVKYVKASIEQFGFKVPIVIDANNIIVAGHTRVLAAKQLGMKEVPCIVADDLTEEQIKAYRLADNKTAEMAEWDIELLNTELLDLEANFDMADFGFEITPPFEGDDDDFDADAVVDAIEEPITKLGDIWTLGRHRLMCGDSTDRETVDRLMDGAKADMVFADPPYGMGKENEGIANDNLNFDKLLEFNKRWIPLSLDVLTEVGSWYCWGTDEPLMDIYSVVLKPMAKVNALTFRNLLTWDKGYGQGQLGSSHRMYATADEKCLFVMKGVQGFNTNADNYYEGWEPIRAYLVGEWRKISEKNDWDKRLGNRMGSHYFTKSQWTMPTEEQYRKLQEIGAGNDAFKRDYDDIKREYDDIKREYYETRAYFDNLHDNMNNVWHFDRTSADEREYTGGHATPKPLALVCRAVKTSSRESETVFDPFGGSGSTLIACEQHNRTCYMMELDCKYSDVIIKRWETLTGDKAVLNG